MRQICKRFGQVAANAHMDFSAKTGEIHQLTRNLDTYMIPTWADLSGEIEVEAIEDLTTEENEEALSGNLCRCTGYGEIARAVHRTAIQGRIRS